MHSHYKSKKRKDYRHFYYSLGKKWYKRLKASPEGYTICLLNDHPEHTLTQKIVVGIETSSQEQGKEHSRLFALFNSYIELYNYQMQIAPDQRYLYEIIFGDLPQKPHFDIDIKDSECPKEIGLEELGNVVKDEVIANILAVGKENGVKFSLERDILVYTSHGETKRSYHIVIHHHCHSNHEQAKSFYKAVTGKMKVENAVYVDHSVYSSKQNFRLLGSQKILSYRPKKFCETYSFAGKEVKHLYDVDFLSPEHKQLESFKISLLSWVSECEYLPSFQDDSERERYIKHQIDMDYGDLSDTSIEEAIQIMHRSLQAEGSKFPFAVREVRGNIVSLRRLRPSWCYICERTHEHENPYLLIVGRDVHFCCRRSGSKSYLLGTLTQSSPTRSSKLFELSSDDENDGMILCLGDYKPLEEKKEKKPILSIIKASPASFVEQKGQPKEKKDVLEILDEVGLNLQNKSSEPFEKISDEEFEMQTRSQYLQDITPVTSSGTQFLF